MLKRYFLFLILLSLACSHAVKHPPRDPLSVAVTYYKKGKYQKVIDILKEQVSSYLYTPYGDEAEFYLAMSYFKIKDYEDAIVEFEFLVNNFSRSPYREKAYYFLALSYYKDSPTIERDQKELYKALRVIDEFITEYPFSSYRDKMKELKRKIRDKLSIKMADIIKTYYNLEKFISARVYIKLLRESYPNSTGENLSYIFEGLIRKDEGEDYSDLISRIDTTKIPHKFQKYYKKLINRE